MQSYVQHRCVPRASPTQASSSSNVTHVALRRRCCRVAGQNVRAEANGAWKWLRDVFAAPKDRADGARKKAASELLQLLTDDSVPDLQRVNEVLDELVGTEGQPFSERQLGGGPWVVRFTRGKPLLWNLTYNTGRLINSKNRASQEFDPADRSAVNLVEINGPDNFLAAYGTYEAVDDSQVIPKTIRARITSGRLVSWGMDLPLPIAGTGLFDVLYVDDSLRVFRSSSNRYAVQVRADRLPGAAPMRR